MIYNPLANLQWAAASKVQSYFYQDEEIHDEIKSEAGKKCIAVCACRSAFNTGLFLFFLAEANASWC